MTEDSADYVVDARPAPRHCALCGVRNFAVGGRTSDGTFIAAYEGDGTTDGRITPVPGRKGWCGKSGPEFFLRLVRVVCVTMPASPGISDEPFLACQRCVAFVKRSEVAA